MMKNAAFIISVGGRDIRRQKIFTGATKRALPIVYTGETQRKQKKPLGGRAG